MRVVTLCPAATAIVAALGDLRLLVGISHECDYPPLVRHILGRPRGFGVERARAELDRLTNPQALEFLRAVPTSMSDGKADTSRPGPRLVDGAARIRAAICAPASPGVHEWLPAGAC